MGHPHVRLGEGCQGQLHRHRKYSSGLQLQKAREAVPNAYWDYRMERPPQQYFRRTSNGDNSIRQDNDCSVLTMCGKHRVQHTLIRAYFSPAHTTGQRFIYTGCSKGKAVGGFYYSSTLRTR